MPKDEEYPVLTQFRGTLDYAKVAEIRDGKHGRVAVLAEPFESRMGVFGYDDLLKNGRAESAGFIVYTPDFWNANRSTEIERCMKQ
jgi:hypothetical protein